MLTQQPAITQTNTARFIRGVWRFMLSVLWGHVLVTFSIAQTNTYQTQLTNDNIETFIKQNLRIEPNRRYVVQIQSSTLQAHDRCTQWQLQLAPGYPSIGRTKLIATCPQVSIQTSTQAPAQTSIQRYFMLNIQQYANVYVAQSAIKPNTKLDPSYLRQQEMDITQLRQTPVEQLDQIQQSVSSIYIGAGQIIMREHLKAEQLILRGENIQLDYTGNGFMINLEAKALMNGALGEKIQVQTSAGKVVYVTITGPKHAQLDNMP